MNRVSVSPRLVVGLVALVLIGWFLYYSIEFYEETEESQWSLEAFRNPYLAAELFMQRSDIEVTDVDSLARLDELTNIGTLFFSDPNQVQSPRQLQQVMDWLDVGGNVIYTANSVSDNDDLLLQEIGVEVEWRDYEDEEREDTSLAETFREYNRQIREGKSPEEIARELSRDTWLTTVAFDDSIGSLEIAFETEKVLQHPYLDDSGDSQYQPFSWSSSEQGVHMMQFEIGSGLLTVISDPGIWTSYRIFEYDHAYLLWLLSSGEGVFALLRSVVRDSLWSLITRNAGELLIAGGLLLALWIWHVVYRFGRMLPRDLSRTRALGEHFSSISHYLWHRRRGAYLIAPLCQRVLRRATLTLGEFARADHARQMELIAERADVSLDAVRRVFDSDDFSETTFVTTVRLLKRIEQAL